MFTFEVVYIPSDYKFVYGLQKNSDPRSGLGMVVLRSIRRRSQLVILDGAECSGDQCLREGGDFDFTFFFFLLLVSLKERHFLYMYC